MDNIRRLPSYVFLLFDRAQLKQDQKVQVALGIWTGMGVSNPIWNKLANVSCSVVGLGDLVHNSILHTYIESIVCIEIQRIRHKFISESSHDHVLH